MPTLIADIIPVDPTVSSVFILVLISNLFTTLLVRSVMNTYVPELMEATDVNVLLMNVARVTVQLIWSLL